MKKNKDIEEKLEVVDLPEEDNDEEILALKEQVEKNIKEKSKETYTKEEVNEILRNFERKLAKNQESMDDHFVDILDPNAKKRKFVRLARLNGKFVVGMKDMNTDSYSDEPVYFQNIEHPTRKGEYIPWTTFIFDEGEPELYPYLPFMNKGVGVWAEVLEEKKIDVSENHGTVDVKTISESNEWSTESTGQKVLAKALKYKTVYVCKEIKNGKIMEVQEDVINKVAAPWTELDKFIKNSK